MKIAFATSGNDLSAPLESRFGRAAKILVFDSEQESVNIIDNKLSMAAAQGAGILTAEAVARAGAQVLIASNCGPKAFRVLKSAGIQLYTSDATTVAEALKAWQAGQLKALDKADVKGHLA